MSICTKHKYIHYISEAYEGKTHDYALLKELFPPDQAWFSTHTVRVDLGFKGMDKDYVCKKVYIPYKRSKNKELTAIQKADNQALTTERVCIEHCFAGLKRYRILADRARCQDWTRYNQILGVCAALWNFNVTNSKSSD